MDISLNISSAPRKPTINITAIKPVNVRSPGFKWDKKKTASAIVNKKGNLTRSKFIPTKAKTKDTTLLLSNENNNISNLKLPQFRSIKPQTTDTTVLVLNKNPKIADSVTTNEDKLQNEVETKTNKFKPKTYPLFDKFSKKSDHASMYDYEAGVPSIEHIFSDIGSTFTDLNIHPHIAVNLGRMDIKTLTSVQEKAIPLVLAGKNVFVRSQTGSGKTLTYAVPIVNILQNITPHITRKDGVQVVVVLPTRELALQTYELFLKLVEPFRWIVPGQLCGGENRNSEKARLRKGINILIGTPGRLLDHVLHTESLKLNTVRCLVLDEADRLLDMGFQKDVNRLIEEIDQARNNTYDPMALMKAATKQGQLNNVGNHISEDSDNSKKDRQTILLSATLTSNVKDLASFTMKDYIYVDPLHTEDQIDLDPVEYNLSREVVVPETVQQEFVVTDVKTKLVVLSSFIVSKALKKTCKMFIFMASRQMVEYHEALFKKCLVKRSKNESVKRTDDIIAMQEDSDDEDGEEEVVLDIQIFKLHGSMEQRERVNIFKAFRASSKGILLCTDVAARGVDVPHADYVVQYTGPLQIEDYIHRVGRTGRAGQKGYALLFVTEPELEFIEHLKEKRLFMKREDDNNLLKHLLPFMDHVSPGGVQAAAEMLQRRFEKAVQADESLRKAASFAYSSWSRYYSSFPAAFKQFFKFKKAHLGHYVTSFALRHSPQEVGQIVRTELGKTEEKRLNKKLSNHDTNDAPRRINPLKPKKRPRGTELLISEFDSGLGPIKKKNKLKTKLTETIIYSKV